MFLLVLIAFMRFLLAFGLYKTENKSINPCIRLTDDKEILNRDVLFWDRAHEFLVKLGT